MSIKRYTVLLLVALAALAVFVPALYADLTVGTKAPDVVLPTVNGQTFNLSDAYKQNKAVVLEFISVHCSHCVAAAPYMVSLNDKYAKRGLAVVSVAVSPSMSDVADFAKRFGITYSVAMDRNGSTADLYKVEGVPTIYIIDGKGNIRYEHKGFPVSSADQAKEASLLGSEVEAVISAE